MPRKLKYNHSRSSNIARPKKVARFNEMFLQAELQRLEQVEREAANRAAETPEQSQARRRRHAEYLVTQRAAETPEEPQGRRLQQATYMSSQRDTETIEVAESRKRALSERAQQRHLIFTRNTWGYLIKLHLSDKEAQVNRRSKYVQGVERNTIQKIQQVLHDHNILVHEFKIAKYRVTSDNFEVVMHPDRVPRGEYERRSQCPDHK
ncbi:helitron_like_N domain-containing protein [Trichonephila clavipes]|nr:helitron_like_N domain-containing protein [Trichonephila clavipes]